MRLTEPTPPVTRMPRAPALAPVSDSGYTWVESAAFAPADPDGLTMPEPGLPERGADRSGADDRNAHDDLLAFVELDRLCAQRTSLAPRGISLPECQPRV